MNAHNLRILDMLNRVVRFILEHPINPAMPRATAAHAEVLTTIAALDAAAQLQTSGAGESAGGVDLRDTTSRALRSFLKDVNRTARSLEPEHPGIAPTFRLPKSGSYTALKASAQSIVAAATEIQDDLIDAGLPSTFLTELGALVSAFEAAHSQKLRGSIARVQGTAGLKARATLGVLAATRLDACVRNRYRGNPEMLAAWTHARKIARAPRRRPADEPAPPSGSGTGSAGETTTLTAIA